MWPICDIGLFSLPNVSDRLHIKYGFVRLSILYKLICIANCIDAAKRKFFFVMANFFYACEGWQNMSQFCREKRKILKKQHFLCSDFEHIPSKEGQTKKKKTCCGSSTDRLVIRKKTFRKMSRQNSEKRKNFLLDREFWSDHFHN